ncbi:MAG TPA: hypothetical protein PLQ36_04300, partial [Candidatus Gracilibacteria bacterium]|nr:hypothetical protein [Candidatus Gracilibacteria bacterium]
AGKKARDTIRTSDLNQVATILGSLQNRFHVPPLSGPEGGRYPESCRSGTDLQKCLQTLKIAPDAELAELLRDPKQGSTLNDGPKFEYFYAASTDGFKVCAFLEDQGAFDLLNANSNGIIGQVDEGENSTNMYCIMHGKGVETKQVEAITVSE